jgi:Zn-dependent protease/predicted transcriptional regulator
VFGKRFDLFTIFGFKVRADVSWIFLSVIVTWSLATQVFPFWSKGLSTVTYWWMGAVGAVGLFVSIVLHELSHSLVARQHGVVMSGITLFIFGGVAEMTDEPPSPRAEFQVAIAGPLMSVLVAIVCWGFSRVGASAGWPEAATGTLRYLGFINIVLVLFNMIPAFPLDGGRVLRSIIWHSKKSLINATRVTANIGIAFSYVLIGLGVLRAILGDIIGGLWSFLIGMFLRAAANMSYQQLLVRRSLEGQTVRRFMKTEPITVPGDVTIRSLVEDYVYRYHHKIYPVIDHERLIGCITTKQLKEIPMEQWVDRLVKDIAHGCSEENTIDPETDAAQALARMSQSGNSRLMVVKNGELLGIVTLKDMLQFLSLKFEIEG